VVDTGQHIVVVDDDSDIVGILAQVLRAEGHEALPFTQSDHALQSMLALRPALLITDLVMPVLSGQELIARVRVAHGPVVPILVMSASLHIAAIAGLPVQAFLSKPFDLDDFCATVQALLQPAYAEAVRVEASCSST
jgi:DNA-binding response OmpR family regulator